MAEQQEHKEPFISYWIKIANKPTDPLAVKHEKLNFCTYLLRYFSQQWQCPPHCLDASAVGQAFTVTTPMLTLFLALVSWFVGGGGEFPWMRLAVSTLVGIPVGLVVGYWYVRTFNRTVHGNEIAIDREELRQMLR